MPTRASSARPAPIPKTSTSPGEPRLLGSDVWSKFGSLQVDYANETLTVG